MADRALRSTRWLLLGLGAVGLVMEVAGAWVFLHRAPRDRGERFAPDNFAAANAKAPPFTVPEGYVAELVAGPPLVKHPMFASLDDRGRLYVAGSSGSNAGPEERRSDPPDVIRRLEDTDGDGHFDRSTIFADGMTYPQGVLWHDGAVYVASPPSLWRLEDADGDGQADHRTELLTGFAFTGIADDLHGPSVGPDGRLYFGVGRFPYEIRRPGGPVIRKGHSPLVMRCRTDGSEAEVVSSGMGNPVEVAFTAQGEPLACGTFFAPSAMGASARDAIIHCVLGGAFPVRDRIDHEDRQTGEMLPPLVHLGVAAPSGLVCARTVPERTEKGQMLYSALFNMHKIQSHRLERKGGTFHSRNEDFLVSTVADFHPTDVLEDADGSLIVVDTGGWFRACPTSQIDKADTFGAIYRVSRRGASGPRDPRGLALDWSGSEPERFAARLDDPRFAVRERAAGSLVRLGPAAVPALEKVVREGTGRSRREAVMTLARIGGGAACAAIRPALDDADTDVRLVATTAAGLLRDTESLPKLIEIAASSDLALRREGATSLGRIGRPGGIPVLLEGLRTPGDRFVDHAQIFALIQIGDAPATLPALDDRDANVRRGALIALDQMRGTHLTPDLVAPLVDARDPAVRETAIRVIASRPEWSRSLVEIVRPWLGQAELAACEKEVIEGVLPRVAQQPEVQQLVASGIESGATPVETRIALLQVISQARLPSVPRAWRDAIAVSLDDPNPRIVRQAAATIRSRGMVDYDKQLIRIAGDRARPKELRIEALEASAPHLGAVEPAIFTYLQDRLKNSEPPLIRMAAARCLGAAPLDASQLTGLCRVVARAGPLVLARILPAFRRSNDREVGMSLVSALSRSPGLRSLTTASLRETFAEYPAEVRAKLEPLLKRLELKATDKSALMATFSPVLGHGVPDRGRDVFYGERAACSACHSVRGIGGKVGPDLTGIGAVRNGRDLLEAVLFPSASFARGFEPYVVATQAGNTLTALIKHESAGAITFLTAAQEEVELRRSEIAALQPSRESIMPRGLEANMSRDELADLLAFLGSLN